jgi:hypothetical protein
MTHLTGFFSNAIKQVLAASERGNYSSAWGWGLSLVDEEEKEEPANVQVVSMPDVFIVAGLECGFSSAAAVG